MISKRALLDGPIVPLKGLAVDQIEDQFQRLFIDSYERAHSTTFVDEAFLEYVSNKILKSLRHEERDKLMELRDWSEWPGRSEAIRTILRERQCTLVEDVLMKLQWLRSAKDALLEFTDLLNGHELEAFKSRLCALSAAEIELVKGELIEKAQHAFELKRQIVAFEMAA